MNLGSDADREQWKGVHKQVFDRVYERLSNQTKRLYNLGHWTICGKFGRKYNEESWQVPPISTMIRGLYGIKNDVKNGIS